MIKSNIVNADGIDVSNEKGAVQAIKKPACFHAIRREAHVNYRKINSEGSVDLNKRSINIALSTFMANFRSFNAIDEFCVTENFKEDTFFYVGPAREFNSVYGVKMGTPFLLTNNETNEVIKFKAGDFLVTPETGINIGIKAVEWNLSYLPKENLTAFTKPDIKFIRPDRDENLSL